jgi:hypothetical protein
MLVDRILRVLEEAPDECLVHHCDPFARFVVGAGEVTPARQLHTQMLKVIRADPVP